MIRRLRIGSQVKPRFGRSSEQPLFEPAKPARSMKVLIDSGLLDTGDESFSRHNLLIGLLAHESIDLYRFSDTGPPPDVIRSDVQHAGIWADGWAVLGPDDPSALSRPVYWQQGDTITQGGLFGNAPAVARKDERTDTYRELSPEDAGRRRQTDAVAAQVAEALDADIYITERDYLHGLTWSLAKKTTFLRADDAFPLVGLFLRAQGNFIVWKHGKGSERYDWGLFYWVAVRELIPSSWGWFAACGLYDERSGIYRLTYIGQSVLERIGRVLRLRDQMHQALNRPQDSNVADEILLEAYSRAILKDSSPRTAEMVVANVSRGLR